MTLEFAEQQKKMPKCLGVIAAARQSQHQIKDSVSYDVQAKNTWKHKPLCSVRTTLQNGMANSEDIGVVHQAAGKI